MSHHREWNQRVERVVKDIENQSKVYKIVHMEKSASLMTLYNRCMMVAMFLSPLATTLSGISILIFPDDTYIFTITSAMMTFLSGVIISYVKFNKIEELGTSHSLASTKYTSLEKNIHRQLQLYKSDRMSSHQYLEWLTMTFDELLITSPLIPNEEFLWSHLRNDNG
jgi:hypothetical protein